LCGYFAPKRIRIDVVHEGPLSVDLDHRQPLPVSSLEPWIPADVDLLEVEGELLPNRSNHLDGALAQVASIRVVENDFRLAGPATDKYRA
jgi:hypothetical protein